MASFSIRAARPEDCSDLLRLIKVREGRRLRGRSGGWRGWPVRVSPTPPNTAPWLSGEGPEASSGAAVPAERGRVWGRSAAVMGEAGGAQLVLRCEQKQALAQGGDGAGWRGGSGQWESPLTCRYLPGTGEIRGHGGSSGAN